ncbi:DUF4097 family beta strand repeat-containing protein [Gemmatimonadota bacterium]
MDIEHRLGFAGIGVAAVALVVTQVDSVQMRLSSLNPFGKSAVADVAESGQRHRELMLDREFDVSSGGQLSIDVADADVTVRSRTVGGASVKVFMSAKDRDWGRDLFNRMEFDVQLHGGELSVSAQNPRFERSERDSNRGGVGFHVEVTIPQSYNATVSTGDGDISMGDLQGEVDLTTSDGDIAVGTLSGTLHLRTSDGDVSADALAGQTVSVRTNDGDVRVGALAGPAEISTSDGDIRVFIDRAGDVSLRTSDGDITIYAEKSLQAEVDFSGESVQVASGFTLEGRVSTSGARGSLNGGGPKLFAHTGDGAITIRDGRPDR